MEGSVEAVLQALQPSRSLFDIAAAMLRHAWDIRLDQQSSQVETLTMNIKASEAEIAKTLDRIMKANSATVIASFENRVEELERERLLLEEKRAKPAAPRLSFEQVFEPAMMFLENPWKLYQNGGFTLNRLLKKSSSKDVVPAATICRRLCRTTAADAGS